MIHVFSLVYTAKGRHFSRLRRSILVPMHVLRYKTAIINGIKCQTWASETVLSRDYFWIPFVLQITHYESILAELFICIETDLWRTSVRRSVRRSETSAFTARRSCPLTKIPPAPPVAFSNSSSLFLRRTWVLIARNPNREDVTSHYLSAKVSTRCFHVRIPELSRWLNFISMRRQWRAACTFAFIRVWDSPWYRKRCSSSWLYKQWMFHWYTGISIGSIQEHNNYRENKKQCLRREDVA